MLQNIFFKLYNRIFNKYLVVNFTYVNVLCYKLFLNNISGHSGSYFEHSASHIERIEQK